MSSADLPGGRLPVLLFFLGCAFLICAGIFVPAFTHDELPMTGLVVAALWGTVAIAVGLLLRRTRAPLSLLIGQLWMLVTFCSAVYAWWLHG